MSDRRALISLTVLLLITTLPFVRRAYFVDDFYFVTMAKGILQHPARPYDFVSDDAGIANVAWERGQQPRMVNPPLFHYFLAAVIKVWGDAPWKLRTASLLFSLISLYAMYFLGKRFTQRPFAVASLLAITPAFWLTSYSLLIDNALLAFFLASLLCFIEGHEQRKPGLFILSGVLMAATLLTKYTGVLIIPVILVWHVLNRDRCTIGGTFTVLGVSAALFLGWGVWNIQTYGQMHVLATMTRGFHTAAPIGLLSLILGVSGCVVRWCFRSRPGKGVALILIASSALLAIFACTHQTSLVGWLQTVYLDKIIAVSSFLGGCSVFLFFAPVLLGKGSASAWAGLGMTAILLFICFASKYGGFDRSQSAQLTFFILSAIAFLICVASATSPASDRNQLFLLSWLFLGVLELILVMPWTAARYLLLVLPPVCWLFEMLVERTGPRLIWNVAWGTTALLGGMLAYVDYAQANVIVPLSQVLEMQEPLFQDLAPRPPHHWFYLADTFDGSQPYVLKLGWQNVFPFQEFPSGSLFLRSYYRKSSWWTIPKPERFQPVMAWDYDCRIPLRVMDVPASAGFYASCWGSLPYVITRHPLERFELCLVK
jgi:4-amino-4-deoxy-L-arabinose transferase-like glycosyltransferase